MHDILSEIWSTLRQKKLRTSLTGFAVAWGIFMLIALLGAGNGLLNALLDNASVLENSMVVNSGWTTKAYAGYNKNRFFNLDTKDVENLKEDRFSNIVEEVSPRVSQSATITYGKEYLAGVQVHGVAPVYQRIQGLEILHGRFINERDQKEKNKVIVVSEDDAKELLGGNDKAENLLGRNVKVGGIAFKVVGISKADRGFYGHQMFAPYTLIHALYNKGKNIGQIYFSFKNIDNLETSTEFKNAYKRTVLANHNAAPDDLEAIYISDRFEQNIQMNQGVKIMRTALWILGLFTLVSGIVGVSNIMLITVKERTHEFGIRKAIGASPWSILRLIIVEAVLITTFFGYIGMICGLAANQLMDATLDGVVTVAGESAQIFKDPGVGIDVAIKATLTLIIAGTLAGLVPAWKAAKVRPIEALRAE